MEKLAIFDLDGTLVKGFTIGGFSNFLKEKNMAENSSREKIENFIDQYKQGKISYEDFAHKILAAYGQLLKGKQSRDIAELANGFVGSGRLRPFSFSRKLAELIGNKGYSAIIITGSPREIASRFSATLGIKTVFATEYEISEGVFTGKLKVNCALRETKLAVLGEYAKKVSADLKQSVGFGDTHHDLAFLDLVGFPVAINPNEELKKTARDKGWLICENEKKVVSDVKKYLDKS